MFRLKTSLLVALLAVCLVGGCTSGRATTQSDWMKLVPFSKGWIENHWDLPNGEMLVEVNGGSETDNCNIYVVVDTASGTSDTVARITMDPKVSEVADDVVKFLCSTISFKPSFPYLLIYNLKDKTSATQPVCYSVDYCSSEEMAFGLNTDTPKLLSVSVVPDGIDLKFDGVAGGSVASPRTIISGDYKTSVLTMKLFGVSPATDISKLLIPSEGCDLVSSVEIVDGADGQTGLTLNISLNPSAWHKTAYGLKHLESENTLILFEY